MIVTKDLRVDVLGEPLFEKVSLVIRSGERVAVMGSDAGDVTIFLRTLAGEVEMDGGSVAAAGERLAYISPDTVREGADALARIMHERPSFLLVDAGDAPVSDEFKRFIEGFRGGILIASADRALMQLAKTTRVFEVRSSAKAVSSYTGSYADYLVAREKNFARDSEAYDKQQKEKRRLEAWLTQKRKEASNDRSPEKGATIRTKAKYLQREILDKELPKPAGYEESTP
ncbi:MAG: hypothetical protein JWL88_317 [Parcubacteria group bacterium]|nr:hypothetical protein [Parcubacteria group bacterium]